MSQMPESPKTGAEPSWSEALALPLGFLGALLGAALGGYLVYLAASSGRYATVLVGLTVGYGTVLFARRGGVVLAVLAVAVSLAGSFFAEWKTFPFLADPSLGYFVRHIFRLPTFSLVCHAGAAALAGWVVWCTPVKSKKSI